MEYKLSSDDAGLKAAAYSTFCILWRKLTPYVMVMKPMTDLCWICQQNSMAIMRSANTPDSEKSQVRNNKINRLTRAYITTHLGSKRCRGTPSVSNTGAVAL